MLIFRKGDMLVNNEHIEKDVIHLSVFVSIYPFFFQRRAIG